MLRIPGVYVLQELLDHLEGMLSNEAVVVTVGQAIVEVKPQVGQIVAVLLHCTRSWRVDSFLLMWCLCEWYGDALLCVVCSSCWFLKQVEAMPQAQVASGLDSIFVTELLS